MCVIHGTIQTGSIWDLWILIYSKENTHMVFPFHGLHFFFFLCERVAEQAPVLQLPKESKGQGIAVCAIFQTDYMKREKVCASEKRNQMRVKER